MVALCPKARSNPIHARRGLCGLQLDFLVVNVGAVWMVASYPKTLTLVGLLTVLFMPFSLLRTLKVCATCLATWDTRWCCQSGRQRLLMDNFSSGAPWLHAELS